MLIKGNRKLQYQLIVENRIVGLKAVLMILLVRTR